MSQTADEIDLSYNRGLREQCNRCSSLAIIQCESCGALCCLKCDMSGTICLCGHADRKHEAVHSAEANRRRNMNALSKALAESIKKDA